MRVFLLSHHLNYYNRPLVPQFLQVLNGPEAILYGETDLFAFVDGRTAVPALQIAGIQFKGVWMVDVLLGIAE